MFKFSTTSFLKDSSFAFQDSYLSYGTFLYQKQALKTVVNGFHRYHPENHDYGYIEYFRKSMLNDMDPFTKECMAKRIKVHEGRRDYFTESLRQINHLIQIDEKPNVQLTEPEWELYKISISFQAICKL